MMAENKIGLLATGTAPRPATASPPPNCAICLGTCTNRCFSDSCLHEFCFKCLLEWSKIKAECPLCKQTFKSILHNIKSLDEYDEHIVENPPVEDLDRSLMILPPSTATPPPHQYHFRTTFTVDTHGEHAIQQMLLSHQAMLTPFGTITPDRYHHRRRRGDTSTIFRRSIYNQNLWVYAPSDITGRYRDVSPNHYRRDPAARARLVPWLNRELNALLYENTQLVMRLVDIIMDHLLRHHICSPFFRALLRDYLGNKTDHFIHEFYNFMRSPFDMIGYDRAVVYTELPTSPTPYIDVSDDYDSDVIFVTTNEQQQGPPGTAANRRIDSVVIELIDTDSDEPIIVSEEINGNSGGGGVGGAAVGASAPARVNDEGSSNSRKPVLPLKLRLKNKHKSREKHSVHRKKRRILCSNVTNSSSDSVSDWEVDRSRGKGKSKKRTGRVEKKRHLTTTEESSDSEDDISLSVLARKKRRNKHSSKRNKSHTVTSSSSKTSKKSHNKHQVASSSRSRSPVPNSTGGKWSVKCNSSSSSNSRSPTPDPERQSSSKPHSDKPNEDPKRSTPSPKFNLSPSISSPHSSGKKVEEHSGEEPSCSDGSLYGIKIEVKSQIRDLRNEDKFKSEPSTSILKSQESSNLWYSRPNNGNYESDSSSSY